jgi:Niemann-Pick C1 protein
MFLYATLSLGNFSSVKRFFIDAKISVGFSGIIIVIASCTSAIGLVSYFGMRITMIIAEVIPFLVLAIGVDNLFLLVHTFERVTAEQSTEGHCDTVERRIAMTLSRTGPSVLLSALSETLAFGLGSVVSMPAVRSFAIVAALAVWIDFCLQITCFAAVLALDAKRVEVPQLYLNYNALSISSVSDFV